MRLLVSMCNLGLYNSQYSFAVVDFENNSRIQLVDCRSFINPAKDTGLNGVCRIGDLIAVTIQSNVPRIAFLDRELKPVAMVEHRYFSDLHSLTLHEGQLYVVCTGNNKILKVDPKTRAISVFWEYHIDEPCLHINSLAFVNGRPLVSSHSMPAEASVKGHGGCWYLDNYEVAIPKLQQPHSLTVRGETIYCLSSHDSRVAIRKSGKLIEHKLRGYLRGMLIGEDDIYVASSSTRFVSRKQAGIQKYVDFDEVVGNRRYMSEMIRCDGDFKQKRRINITQAGFEPYEVVEDPGVPEALKTKHSVAVRMQTMYRQNLVLREQLHSLRRKTAKA